MDTDENKKNITDKKDIVDAEKLVEDVNKKDNKEEDTKNDKNNKKATPLDKLRKHLVSSSNIEWVAYDNKIKKLYVHFTSNSTYEYENVPKDVFERLLKAGSKGRYFAAAIKWNYKYKRIE